ncbi:head maturation protease, ClpP-related [Methylobacterium organophilum]|uniref:ATP-dependent Clp protease proteolytic subunit n=1 Tax=Methylobacterium organophilum TaxID=410 RepID=A0ABQ4TCW4_METOR|nr:head maturation protease, ClpP-related [Methylobacterium organophilum]GJE27955.1 ATP-dependent Clp protease proteolytic subunit [Methylobacterium organophilum]
MPPSSLLVNGEILLYGDVGDPWCWGDGFTVADVAGALAEHGSGDVTVRINSGGGVAFDGVAIYSLLLAHPGKVTCIVDGIAASAASLILMAGEVRQIRDGAMVMIHDASGVTFGTAADHLRNATVLDKLSDQYAGIYAARSGMERDAAREMMKTETWLDADEAVAKGLATGKIEDLAETTASFDYRIYAHAPQGLPTRSRPKAAPAASTATAKQEKTVPAENTTETTVVAKAWAQAFYAAASEADLPLKTLIGIVAKADTAEAAETALAAAIEAAKAKPEPQPEPAPTAPVAQAGKTWTQQFYAAAENSGLRLKTLNEIVAKSASIDVAKDALIDAMSAAQSGNKPPPAAGHLSSESGKDDKAASILASFRKAGGRTRETVAR